MATQEWGGGVNAAKIAQAVINALTGPLSRPNNTKPRAKWRSNEEYKSLLREGKCIRCGQTGHKTRACQKYGPAKKPASISHIKSPDKGDEIGNKISQSDSEDEVYVSGEE